MTPESKTSKLKTVKKISALLLAIPQLILLNPSHALAVNIGTEFPLAKVYPNIGALISVLLKNAFVLAGLLAFVILIFSGVRFILGGGNKEETQKASAGISSAIGGLFIIFVSYWIIRIIEIITGINILNQ